MMESEALILAIGTVCFLLLYFSQTLKGSGKVKRDKDGNEFKEDHHVFLRLMIAFFFVFLLTLIPKVALDYQDNCKVAINTTEAVNDTYTIYTYEYFCDANTETTVSTFYISIQNFVRFFALYIGLYYSYLVLVWMYKNDKLPRAFKKR